MLIRQNYYVEKRNKIKKRLLKMLENLVEMTDHYISYMDNPSIENKEFILKAENYVDQNERKIEEHILEAISLQQLNLHEIKWLLGMNRIIRELERFGDQITNIVTISNAHDVCVLKPMILPFLDFERAMIDWLIEGIREEDADALKM
ncbi:PhoU domain-containing protein [Bacillus sp. N9]